MSDPKRSLARPQFQIKRGQVFAVTDPAPPWRQNLLFGAVNTDWTEIDEKQNF